MFVMASSSSATKMTVLELEPMPALPIGGCPL
jgi:hypothetical protein